MKWAALRSLIAVSAVMIVALPFGGAAELAEKNEYKVKNAFRDAVREAARSTVRVICNGQRAALGAVVGADGYIVTKASEVTGDVVCHLDDGRQLKASVVEVSAEWDIALLKVDADGLPVIQWGDDKPPSVGSWLATPGIGSLPLSIGVVSVAPRRIERRLPALGIILADSGDGPRVDRVVDDSAAADAEIRRGDIIKQLNDKAITNREMLIGTIRTFRPGDVIRLTILRGQKELKVEAKLGDMSAVLHGEEHTKQVSLGGRLSDRRANFPLALQHDTVLFPNQCGGPLVDLKGQVVGLNIARASRVASYAVPASAVKPLVDQWLKEEQTVSTASE